MSQMQQIVEQGNSVLIGNYARLSIAMVRGQGADLWDADGAHYIDLFAGFGGCILGHCHPALVQAASEQAKMLWHVGNTFHTRPQIEFAERIRRHAFEGKAFFCHSGLEANEAACKLARLRGNRELAGRFKILSLSKSFHGRSLAMIAATGNTKVKEGFEPAVPGFAQVEPGSFSALEQAVDEQTCGIILEVIQGEGGINLQSLDYMQRVRELCDRRNLTLIFDEVWTGCGRTGRWFAYQHLQKSDGDLVEPDILTLGKAVGGGLPAGVMYAKPHLAKFLVPGTHGCTLGGNPICMAVAKTIFDVIEQEKLTEHAASLGEIAIARLQNEPRIAAKIVAVRGRGLMLGIELAQPPQKLVETGLANGVVINLTAQKVIRLAPPINISRQLWEQGLDRVIQTIAAI